MLVLAFLGGLLTIASPCILPVVPLVFSRAGRSFQRETLPMLAGLAAAFALAASIATTSAKWLLDANDAARAAALALFALVGIALLSPRLAGILARPAERLGARMARPGQSRGGNGVGALARNVVIGAAVGLLWAPCAGPILGLLIAAAATTSAVSAAALFFTFALGAATMLGITLALGARVIARIRRVGSADVVVRRTLGVATLATVLLLATGRDQPIFGKFGLVATGSAEEALVHRFAPGKQAALLADRSLEDVTTASAVRFLPTLDAPLPAFDGATEWINSPPLTPEALKGKVVLVDFWTFACYNCLNALPHVKALAAKYGDKGLVVVGVHTPELARERVLGNVRREVKRLGITYAVVVDNDYKIWNAFHNEYWPAAYYADKTGKLRFYHFGEGAYDEQDKVVAELLAQSPATHGTR
ncbi:MAG: cytochrome c biogenesis protein/redoxin [Gemmatimonadaceae bacterium]